MADDPARTRFLVIQLVRWVGLAMVIAGLLAIDGRIALPREAGYGLFLAGLLEALILPTILARRWKSPPP